MARQNIYSTISAYGFVGGGGSVYTPLVPGANPASQYAGSGTTSLSFIFNPVSGGQLPYVYAAPSLTATPGSAATISGTVPGVVTINNCADNESYLIRAYVTDNIGQQVLMDALGHVESPLIIPIPQIIPPARQALAASVTSASVTFTQPGAPGGITYGVTISNITTGSSVTASSGSGLGPYVFPVVAGNDYVVKITSTAADGQIAINAAEVAVAEYPPFTVVSPNPQQLVTGTTTTSVSFNAPTGGSSSYTIGTVGLIFDSTDLYTATASGSGLGPYAISGLVDNATYIFALTFTDNRTGDTLQAQSIISVNAGAATLTFATTPPNQNLPSSTVNATLGTWGAVSGGTGPYTYAVTELSLLGSVIGGSGLGPYTVSNLSPGQSFVYLMTATDSLGAKGYSVVTLNVAASTGAWEVVSELDFTTADWTAFSSTAVTASTTVPLLTIYAADGVTARAQIWNNSASVRRQELTPGSVGLILASTNAAATPSFKVVPLDSAGRNVFTTLAYTTDMIKVEIIAYQEENAGSAAASCLVGFSSTPNNGSIQYGYDLIFGTTLTPRRRSWVTTAYVTAQSAITASGPYRILYGQWEAYITGSRVLESYANYTVAPLGYATTPRSGKYYFAECASQTMTTTPALISYGTTATATQFGVLLYLDGSTIDGGANRSRVVLQKLRISRLPNGSKPLTYNVSASGAVFLPLMPIVGPARQSLAAATTSATMTFTQPGAPIGMVYALTITNVTTGAVVTPSSGSGLGPYVFPVSFGNDYAAVLVGTSTDGQVARAVGQVAVASYALLAAGANPASQYLASGVTSANMTFLAATGGRPPLSYSAPSLVRSGTSVATVSGTAPGVITVNNLVDGDTCLVRVNVTDANGQIVSNSGFVNIAKPAPLPPGGVIQLPPSTLNYAYAAAGATSATITFTDPSGLPGTTYALAVKRMVDGAAIVPSSGSGVGPYNIPVSDGNNYTAVLTANTTDGQSVNSEPAYMSVLPNNSWAVRASLDLTTDITAGTSSIASGSFNILAGDGVTVKAAVTVASSGTFSSRLFSWAPSTGLQIRVVDNNDGTSASYYCGITLTTLFASVTNWSRPVLIEALFNNFLIPADADGTVAGFYLGTTITLTNNSLRGGYQQTGAGEYALETVAYTGAGSNSIKDPVTSAPINLTLFQFLIIGNQIYVFMKTNAFGFYGQPIVVPDATTQVAYNLGASVTLTSPYASALLLGNFTNCKGPHTSGCYLLKAQISQYNGGFV